MSNRLDSDVSDAKHKLRNKVRIDLDGRFMLPSKQEHSCRVLEMSTDEMLIACDATPAIGTPLIIYTGDLGRLEGKVERHQAEGFVVGLSLPPLKHKKIAELLVWHANRGAFDMADNRRHKRFAPLTQLTTLRLPNGKECIARINDVSASGVNVAVNLKTTLLVGSTLFVGSKKATVLRLQEGGFVARFEEDFQEGAVDESIIL
ncbi:PilZ domain-containing protein [Methylocystis sp. JAN1]|uniref:PilZ domain-containing protein n=1 Tax=Methylocystis sp. JAN1 TaxID=3397211 RepID=UPI003FA25758